MDRGSLLHVSLCAFWCAAKAGALTPACIMGAAIVRRPLEAFVNVFEQCKAQHGDTRGLLTALARHAVANPGASYRVGVKQPASAAGTRAAAASAGDAGWSLLASIQKNNKVVPALLQLSLAAEVAQQGDDADACAAAAAADGSGGGGDGPRAVLVASLWRADMVASSLETNKCLTISRADEAAALLFGLPQKSLLKRDLRK